MQDSGTAAAAEGPTEPSISGQLSGEEAAARAALPILLFDLNGTLTSHTSQRYSAGITRTRPGVEAMARLAHKCRYATSAPQCLSA